MVIVLLVSFQKDHTLEFDGHDTMDKRSPFRATLKPWQAVVCRCLPGYRLMPGFVGRSRSSSTGVSLSEFMAHFLSS